MSNANGGPGDGSGSVKNGQPMGLMIGDGAVFIFADGFESGNTSFDIDGPGPDAVGTQAGTLTLKGFEAPIHNVLNDLAERDGMKFGVGEDQFDFA